MNTNFNIYRKWLQLEEEFDAYDETVNLKRELIESLKDSPAYQVRARINGAIVPIVANRKGTNKCKFTVVGDDDVYIGDLVEVYGENWLVVELNTDEYGITSGEIWMCNQVFVYQKFDNTIVTKNAILDDGSYSKPAEKSIVVGGSSYDCYMQLDDDNNELFVDKRLAIDVIYDSTGKEILEVGKVTWIDKKSINFGEGSHLLKLKLEHDVYDEYNDDITKMICNYREVENTISEYSNHLEINGRSTMRLGTSRTYTANYSDENGDIEGVDFEWSIVEAPNGVKIDANGASCVVTCPVDNKILGYSFILKCVDNAGICGEDEVEVEIING